MSLFQSNGALKYGGPIDLRMFAHKASVPDEVAKARGALAHPGVPLADLAHVGEMVKDLGLYAPTKYIDAAFRVLDECPLQDDIVRRPFLESPDSWRYAAHLKALDRATVLGVYGVYDRDLGVILGPRGVVLPLPLFARYSAVHKDALEARAIFNMVYSNALMKADTIKFSLLGSRAIISRLRSMDFERCNYRILHYDLRNAFYLLGVSEQVGDCCCVRLGDLVYRIRVCPMGWRRSCGCMQAITNSCILFKLPDEENLGVDPGELERAEVPAFIPLSDGGGIITVYDSVMHICEEKTAAKWRDRVLRNFGQAKLALKYLTLEGLNGSPLFCGIQMFTDRNGLKWSLDVKSVETWKAIVAQSLVPSPRTLFRLCGWLRFAGPILGWSECRLGRLTKAQSELGQVTLWDQPNVNPAVLKLAFALIEGIDEKSKQHRRSHVLKRGRSPPFYFAVDATPTCWAVYAMAGGVPVLLMAHHFGGDYDLRGKWVPSVAGCASSGPDVWPIDEAESFALLQGIKIGHAQGASLLICANDNQVVGWNYTNGYSRNNVIDHHIVESKYADGQATLLIADTPTLENYADIATRPNHVYPLTGVGSAAYRKKCTWDRLQAVRKHWECTASQYLLRAGATLPQAVIEDDACIEQEPSEPEES